MDTENRIQQHYEKYRELLKPYVSQQLLDFLDESDFRTAPASAREEFHGCWKGGLVDHSLGVYRYLKMMNGVVKGLYGPDEIARTALLHDLCKAGCYHKEKAWRKDNNGKWETYLRWKFDDAFPAGHGAKSVMLILQHGTKLGEAEILAITHHMGPYNLTSSDLATYSKAAKTCPLVLLLHWADMAEANIEPFMMKRTGGQSEEVN